VWEIGKKELYYKGNLGRFKVLELRGTIPEKLKTEIEPLCRALIASASEMLRAIGLQKITTELLHELQREESSIGQATRIC
jgi:hypothetical protein